MNIKALRNCHFKLQLHLQDGNIFSLQEGQQWDPREIFLGTAQRTQQRIWGDYLIFTLNRQQSYGTWWHLWGAIPSHRDSTGPEDLFMTFQYQTLQDTIRCSLSEVWSELFWEHRGVLFSVKWVVYNVTLHLSFYQLVYSIYLNGNKQIPPMTVLNICWFYFGSLSCCMGQFQGFLLATLLIKPYLCILFQTVLSCSEMFNVLSEACRVWDVALGNCKEWPRGEVIFLFALACKWLGFKLKCMVLITMIRVKVTVFNGLYFVQILDYIKSQTSYSAYSHGWD